MAINDGWSNGNLEAMGPFKVFMADGGVYLDIPAYKDAMAKANEQPGSQVGGRSGGVIFTSQKPQVSIIPRDRSRGNHAREKRNCDFI